MAWWFRWGLSVAESFVYVVDWARADTEAELQIRKRQADTHLRRAIEDALARISAGRFGVCEVCKQPISKARLEAVPWRRVCRDCKVTGA